MSNIVLLLSAKVGMSEDFIGTSTGPITFYKVLIPIVFLGLFVFPLSLQRNIYYFKIIIKNDFKTIQMMIFD